MNNDLTVLIIEDDTHMRLACLQALQFAGLSVQAFDSAEAGVGGFSAASPAWWSLT